MAQPDPKRRKAGDTSAAATLLAFSRGNAGEAEAALALSYVVPNMKIAYLVKEVRDAFPELSNVNDIDIAELIAIEKTIETIAEEDIDGLPVATGGRRRKLKGGALIPAIRALMTAIGRVPIQGANFALEQIEDKLQAATMKLLEMPDNQAADYMKRALKKGLIAAAMFDLRNGKSGFIGSVISAVLLVLEKASPSIVSAIMSLQGYKEIIDAMGATAVNVAPGIIATYIATKIIMVSIGTIKESFDPKNAKEVFELVRNVILKLTVGKVDIGSGAGAGAGAAGAAGEDIGARIESKFRIEDAVNEATLFLADDYMRDVAKMRARAEKFGIQWEEPELQPAGAAGIGGRRRRRHRKTRKASRGRKRRHTRK